MAIADAHDRFQHANTDPNAALASHEAGGDAWAARAEYNPYTRRLQVQFHSSRGLVQILASADGGVHGSGRAGMPLPG